MKYLVGTFLVAALTALVSSGCASAPITKWTSPQMRIMVDPRSLSSRDYVRVRQGLVESGRFFVIDRSSGFAAAIREQNLEHGGNAERFGMAERYARLARLNGVGGIVVGNVSCGVRRKLSWLLVTWTPHWYLHCAQSLAFIDANTATVIAEIGDTDDSAEGYVSYSGEIGGDVSDWSGAVSKLVKAIPDQEERGHYAEELVRHREEIAEDSQREREDREVAAQALKGIK